MATTGQITKQYVSALSPFLDTREIKKEVTDINNEDNLTDILDLGSRKKPIATGQPFYSNFLADQLFILLDTTGGTVNGSGTASINFTCTAATSGNTRKDDVLLVTTGNNSIIVTNVVTASGIDTVYAVSVAGVPITLTAGEKVSLYSVAVGEDSTSQTNIKFGMTRQFNKYQIFREISKITDVQTAATIETTFNGQPYFKVKDHIDKQILLKGKINAAFIAGDMSVTSFADANPYLVDPITNGSNGGGAIQTTRGLNKYVDLYGSSIVNGTLGTYQKVNLDDVCDTLLAARAPSEQLVFGGAAARRVVDDYYKALGSSGVQSVRLVVDGKELDLTVDKVTRGGFTFNYMTMPMMNHPALLGNSTIKKSLYYLPLNEKVPIYGGGYDTAMAIRYIPSQTKNGNGMIDELHGGALAWNGAPTYDGDSMNATCSWTTKQGLEVLGAAWLLREQVI